MFYAEINAGSYNLCVVIETSEVKIFVITRMVQGDTEYSGT
jgi:hypothetical protein